MHLSVYGINNTLNYKNSFQIFKPQIKNQLAFKGSTVDLMDIENQKAINKIEIECEENEIQNKEIRRKIGIDSYYSTKQKPSKEVLIAELKKLDNKLPNIETEITDNTVRLKHQNKESIATIPEEFFENCNSTEEKEFLIKSWLHESCYFKDYDNIPIELVKAGTYTGIYNRFSNYPYDHGYNDKIIEFDKLAKENDIYIGRFEKSHKYNEPNILNVTIRDLNYRLEVPNNTNKVEYLQAAAYDKKCENHLLNKQCKVLLNNIKDTQIGFFVIDNQQCVFIPKLYKGIPKITNTTLMKHGNSDMPTGNLREIIKKHMINKVGTDINVENIRKIGYTTDYSDKNNAYSYYDEDCDCCFLYLEKDNYILKKDKSGHIYQKDMHGDIVQKA